MLSQPLFQCLGSYLGLDKRVYVVVGDYNQQNYLAISFRSWKSFYCNLPALWLLVRCFLYDCISSVISLQYTQTQMAFVGHLRLRDAEFCIRGIGLTWGWSKAKYLSCFTKPLGLCTDFTFSLLLPVFIAGFSSSLIVNSEDFGLYLTSVFSSSFSLIMSANAFSSISIGFQPSSFRKA